MSYAPAVRPALEDENRCKPMADMCFSIELTD